MGKYADYTYNSKNKLKRFSHRARLKRSIEMIQTEDDIHLLDFGCGDGLFLNQLQKLHGEKIRLLGFEPILESIEDNNVRIVNEWNDVLKENRFSHITCFEVLEHFAPQKQIELLKQMHSVLRKNGTLIISVPIESGLSSFVKNIIRRRNNKKHKSLYSYKNIFYSLFGRSISFYRQGNEYLEHMGFYIKDLEKIFNPYFQILEKTYSPFKSLGKPFNSQVFFRLQKNVIQL
jgi:cyclopropane fatty-acyl-phospholipid synthase-like methyltransferase